LLDSLTAFLTDPAQWLIVPAALLAIMLHEISHGYAAYRLGDPTAKQKGRLTLNPIPHIDIFGLIAMIIMKFGWAKPVPVDMRYFKNPRRDFALTALAGPASNFLQAFAGLLLFNTVCLLHPILRVQGPTATLAWLLEGTYNALLIHSPIFYLQLFLFYYIILNVGLGVFNLFPIPPLDGSKIVGIVIPDKYYYQILRYERYGMIILMVLLFTDRLTGPLMFLRSLVLDGIGWLAGLPFQLFGSFTQ